VQTSPGALEQKKKSHEPQSQFHRAKVIQPKISFTDLTSMVIMKELGIKDIITGDEHFNGVGMGFKRVP